MENDAYWSCIIGPAKRDELPDGADMPMRSVIALEFVAVTGYPAEHISSGWGQTERYVPNLGYATTRQLLEELKARGEVSFTIGESPNAMSHLVTDTKKLLRVLPPNLLDYRTIDSH